MVRAGEAGGFLDVVLTQISDFRTREADLKGKVKAAMVYPIVLACLAVGVLVFLMTFFIPRFSGIFAQFGASLPALTTGIIAVSTSSASKWGLLVGGRGRRRRGARPGGCRPRRASGGWRWPCWARRCWGR